MSLRDKLKVGQLFTFKDECKTIDIEGLDSVNGWLHRHLSDDSDYYPHADIEPVWQNSRGTFPKRLSSYLYKEHNVRLDGDQVREIGNLLKPYVQTGKTYYYDFTGDFDWDDGDFGDLGSCFWGDRGDSITRLEEHDSMAMRFWKDRGKETQKGYEHSIEDSVYGFRGYGRAWLAFPRRSDRFYARNRPLEPVECVVLFNAYPKGFQKATVARILAKHLNLSYKRIALRCRGSDDHTLWINGRDTERENDNDSGVGYMVGKRDSITEVEMVDLQW